MITELDLLLPDPSSLLADLGDLNLDGGSQNISRRRDIMVDDSSFLHESTVETGRAVDQRLDMDDSVLQLEDDLGLDVEPLQEEERRPARTPRERNLLDDDEISIEMGRDQPPSRGISEEFSRDDFHFDIGGDITMGGTTPKAKSRDMARDIPQLDDDLNLDDDFGVDNRIDFQAGVGEETSNSMAPADIAAASLGLDSLEGLRSPADAAEGRQDRDSMSPLSSVRSSVERELEAEIGHGALLDTTFVDEPARVSQQPEEISVGRPHSAPRKRFLVEDAVIEIRAKQIKSQQEDRTKILKDPSFLPRDPGVLALVTLQRTGGFATSVFYPKNIHPDLAGMLSPEFVKRMAAMKRKREEEQAGGETTDGLGKESPAKRIQLDIGDESMLEREVAAHDAAAAAAREGSAEGEVPQANESSGLIDFPKDISMIEGDDFMPQNDETCMHRPFSRYLLRSISLTCHSTPPLTLELSKL